MTRKKVALGAKPRPTAAPAASADDWVQSRHAEPGAGEGEPMKRLTIDVPVGLHTRIKSQCALRGVKMADEIRELLERHFPQDRG